MLLNPFRRTCCSNG